MGLVTTPLTVEVHCGVRAFSHAARWRLLVVVNPAEALLSCPCLKEGSINGEVLIRKQVALPGQFKHGGEESVGDVSLEKALAVFREDRRIPYGVIHVQADEPTKQ
jgi:hypothetical protein